MAIRQRRRYATDRVDPGTIGYAEAHRRKSAASWPTWRDRRAFWQRPDVPMHLRDSAEPDPRPILSGLPERVDRYRDDRREWSDGRARWLAEAARKEVAGG